MSSLRNAADLYQMVARGLSEAKPLWRREGGRESQLRNACQRRSLSGCQREGGREGGREQGETKGGVRGGKPCGVGGGGGGGGGGGRDSRGKRVRGGGEE